MVIFSRRGRGTICEESFVLPGPLGLFEPFFRCSLPRFKGRSCNHDSQSENSHVLLIWEVSISSFYFSSPADFLLLFLSCCPFPFLAASFSFLSYDPFSSPLAVLSPGLGGSGCLVSGSLGTRTMELPFLLPFPYQISYY